MAALHVTETKLEIAKFDWEVETRWARRYWTFVSCPTQGHTAYIDSIVIAVDGACRNNGQVRAKAGARIFFHANSYRWNQAIALSEQHSTSQRPELLAAFNALRLALTIRRGNTSGRKRLRLPPRGSSRKLRRVVIEIDLAYLYNGMTSWIHKWKENGYEYCKGLPVTNADLFAKLDSVVAELTKRGVNVRF